MVNSAARIVCASGALILFAGCAGSARYLVQDGRGGVIALDGNRREAGDEAMIAMDNHCGETGFIITREGDTNRSIDPTAWRRGSISSVAHAPGTETEYRVAYQCSPGRHATIIDQASDNHESMTAHYTSNAN